MTRADVLELARRQPRRILPDGPSDLLRMRRRDDLSAYEEEHRPHPEERLASAASRRMTGAATPIPMTGAASFLAYLGAAPLLAAALTMIAAPQNAAAQAFLVLYGAALVIFFGGVRWGVAVMKPEGPTMRALLGAVLPMLAALPLFAPGAVQAKMIAIMVLIFVLLIDDLGATRRGQGAPQWYLGVRLPLTVLIEVAFLVALAAGMRI